MRLVQGILIGIAFSLVACEDAGQSHPKPEGSNPVQEEEVPLPPLGQLGWGELKCQKAKDCKTIVLNVDRERLESFLEYQFSVGWEQNSSNFFKCGMEYVEKWMEAFPEHNGCTEEEFDSILEFSVRVLNTETCTVKSNYKQEMKNYFILKGELENEDQ